MAQRGLFQVIVLGGIGLVAGCSSSAAPQTTEGATYQPPHEGPPPPLPEPTATASATAGAGAAAEQPVASASASASAAGDAPRLRPPREGPPGMRPKISPEGFLPPKKNVQ